MDEAATVADDKPIRTLTVADVLLRPRVDILLEQRVIRQLVHNNALIYVDSVGAYHQGYFQTQPAESLEFRRTHDTGSTFLRRAFSQDRNPTQQEPLVCVDDRRHQTIRFAPLHPGCMARPVSYGREVYEARTTSAVVRGQPRRSSKHFLLQAFGKGTQEPDSSARHGIES